MNPTPTLPPSENLLASLSDLATRKQNDSYKWLIEQYDNKCKRLAIYANRQDSSTKFVLQETAFLTALYKHIQQIKKGDDYINIIMSANNDQCKQIRIMEKIFCLYGISFEEVEGYLRSEELLDQDIKFGKAGRMIKTPVALQKHLKQQAA